MTLAIGLVLASIALPFVVGAIQNYRLDSITQQTASLIDLARYSAIRRNMVVTLQAVIQNGNTVLYVDVNNNGLDATDPRVVLPSDMQIANNDPLTPPATSMGLGNTISFAGSIQFDYRGLVNYAGPPVSPYFLALGYTNQTQYGTRAVTVAPMGQTKLWKAPPGGTWTGM